MAGELCDIGQSFFQFVTFCTVVRSLLIDRVPHTVLYLYLHRVSEKNGPFVISSYLYFDRYELHENFQKYIGGVACCEYGINICDSLTILC